MPRIAFALFAISLLHTGAVEAPNYSEIEYRTVVEAETGAEVRISGEGNCSTLKVEVHMPIGLNREGAVQYDISEDCTVVNIVGTSTHAAPEPASIALSNGSLASNNTTSCNYIHSSQTVQDAVNIDIAKHRLATRRCWNGATTWMTSGIPRSYTGVPWNHAYTPKLTRLDTTRSSIAVGKSAGSFHTDWLWCNATSKWQAIELRNTNTSQFNGSHYVSFWQSRACPGTHMSTASKTSMSSTW